jgi:hypothetical protein
MELLPLPHGPVIPTTTPVALSVFVSISAVVSRVTKAPRSSRSSAAVSMGRSGREAGQGQLRFPLEPPRYRALARAAVAAKEFPILYCRPPLKIGD